jgi:ATP-dependent RNA helicase DDX3X
VLSKLFGKALKLKAPKAKPGLERAYQAQPLVLVIGPTRELVWQTFDEARKFCYRSMLRPWYLPHIPGPTNI